MQKISTEAIMGRAPLLIFSTRTGTPYNLTPTNQPKMQALQLSAGDFLHMKPVLRALPQNLSFKKFIGCAEEVLTYLTPYDYGRQHSMNGCNGEKVKVLCRNGYQEVSWHDYYELVQLIKPDFWVALTEIPSLIKEHKEESSNSLKRAIGKTNSFLRSLPKEGLLPGLMLPIHGGHNEKMLQKSLEETLRFDEIAGIVICDLCQAETLEQRQAIYQSIVQAVNNKQEITGKKYRVCLASEGRPEAIKHAMRFGIDCFEVSYPFRLASKQKALIYSNEQFIETEPKLMESLDPLDKSCTCGACTNYSEAYIAHLLKCHEMTGKVLLSMHNSHQYVQHFP